MITAEQIEDVMVATVESTPKNATYVTADLLQRTDHHSVHALESDSRNWVKGWKENPSPFIWTKPAERILESLSRGLQRTTGAGH